MADLPMSFLLHAVQVNPLSGSTATGTKLADPVAVRGFLELTSRKATTATGAQGTSVGVFRTTAEGCNGVEPRTLFPLESIVWWTGGAGRVTAVAIHNDGSIGAWQHTEISLGETKAEVPA